MANITLAELHITGSELFQDSESFIDELGDIDSIFGGNYGYQVSDLSTLVKLAEAFVITYAIDHIAYLAKSYSDAY
ncbi:hypothetical protein IQ259_14485 [Fortiea sp. LEGE XX443]|uniref:hypothetical protein n=1 Tax=Fortiea sp. LEGE XX443 TaxID=1828611 RepID=UPI00187FBFC3|nr:hypothetical protein [Fortiea sp. LEGE XX443]MBE9006230.1 hypothetical protein [Fortiea sp. LEGE XX443]